MIKLTCSAYKTLFDPRLEGRDLPKQQQQHHNLEESSSHKQKLFQKYTNSGPRKMCKSFALTYKLRHIFI
ncbi:uncharacterized protein DS421_17g590170 [Arachis hypogaea]|nr:uncharacterized protein DS421_17g590170 [Arachis hypogaea]